MSSTELETTPLAPTSPQIEFLTGIRDLLPILVGVIPFGMIYGAAAISAGVPQTIAQAMSAIVFAGSSQFIAAQLIGTGTPGFIIVFTIVIVNLRHALYSASVAPYTKPLRAPWKWLLAYLLTDEAYVTAILHYRSNAPTGNKHWYHLGAGLALWLCWQASTAIGIFVGAQIPSSLPLDFALPVSFIALVVPALKDRASGGAALAAGIVGVIALGLPYKLGLFAAALIGIVVGLIIEERTR